LTDYLKSSPKCNINHCSSFTFKHKYSSVYLRETSQFYPLAGCRCSPWYLVWSTVHIIKARLADWGLRVLLSCSNSSHHVCMGTGEGKKSM